MPIYAEKNTRYAHFAEMRQSHIRKKDIPSRLA